MKPHLDLTNLEVDPEGDLLYYSFEYCWELDEYVQMFYMIDALISEDDEPQDHLDVFFDLTRIGI
jgi:hypothetical protein